MNNTDETRGFPAKKYRKSPPKILFCGFYGCGNLGDDALLCALLRAFSEIAPECELSYLTGGDRLLSRVPGDVKASMYSRSPLAALRAIRDSDAVIFGGGSVLQNATGQASLFYYLTLLCYARLCGKKTAILSGGLGPIDGATSKKAVSRVLRRLDYASFRDVKAVAFARTLCVKEPFLSADPALMLSEEVCEIPLPRRFLLVSLRKKSGTTVPLAAQRIFCIARKKGLTPVLCDLFPAEDRRYTHEVAQMISRFYREQGKKTAAWELPRLSQGKLLFIVKRADLVLTGRYHLALFAYSAGVPFRVMGNDPKLLAIAAETRSPEEAVRCVEADIRNCFGRLF